jgi:hypothetical protein
MATSKKPPGTRRGGMTGFAAFLANADSLAQRSAEGPLISAEPAAPAPSRAEAPGLLQQSQPAVPDAALGAEQQPSEEAAPGGSGAVRHLHAAPSPAAPATRVQAATEGSQGAKSKRPRTNATAATAAAVRPMAGREGRLEASGEPIVKWTLELPPQILQALAMWERDETRRLGQRVFRERLVDLALDGLPDGLDAILTAVRDLPPELRQAPGQQFGTRVRASVRDKLIGIKPDLRVAGIKDIRIRDVYSAGVYRYLTDLGITIPLDTEKPRNPDTEN